MSKFSETGHDVVICQRCSRLVDTGAEKVSWRPDITGNESAGNVCEVCERVDYLDQIVRMNKKFDEEAKGRGLGSQLVEIAKGKK